MNSDPNPATSRNHCDSGIPVAAPPAIARSRNPDATMQMSNTAWCLSQKQYDSCTTTYTASTTTSGSDTSRLTPTAAASSSTATATASRGDTTPAAIGR